jgi:predicted transcriptional regulator
MEATTTNIYRYKGEKYVAIQSNREGEESVAILMSAEVARNVAYSLVELADELDPPDWRTP